MDDSSPFPQKQCTGECKQWLPATPEFFYKARNGLRGPCKVCTLIASKAYNAGRVEERKQRYQEHREERLAQVAAYRETHREEVRASQRRYRQTHREEIQAIQQQHYLTHRERFLEKRKQYREHNLEAIRAWDRQHYETHREEAHAKNHRYYEVNQDAIKERMRQDRQERPDAYRIRDKIKHQTRCTRLKGIEGVLTIQQIRDKLKAQKYACYYCLSKFEQRVDKTFIYHLDHTVPISRPECSPRHDVNFIVLACPFCNQSKSDKLPHEWIEGGRLL